jgi:type IX secretion system PorP/SprF family membrane protein
MKKISLLILVSVFVTIGFAQQFPLQSQYQFNYPTINPAASGENNFYRARASFREQWVGLTDNPISTQILTINKGFGVNGLGITVFNDKTGGAFNKSGAAISYSHKVKFKTSNLYFGISGGASKINLSALDDPALLSNDDVIPEFNFGMYYTFNELKIGISIPGLLATNMELSESADNIVDRHLYSMISYTKKLSDDWTAYPSILVKTTANHNQIDANINFKLKNKLWFGTSYRQDFGPTIYVGIDFGKLLSVYSLDISTNEVADYSNGSHELTFGHDFIPDSELEKRNREEEIIEVEIKDKDKDGVDDNVDLCPDVAGYKGANGCPDFDKDGIPDKFDLCPHLFGNANSQGCPELSTAEYLILTRALGDLNFDFDKDLIKQESYITLTDLTLLMHKNPKIYLLIKGHASSEGTASYNLSLSARRAKAVQNFFISRGINKGRLIIDFYGEDTPLNKNTTEQERADNRRVEFDIKYHLYDDSSAEDLQEEYDSLLNTINNNVVDILDYDEVIVQQPIIIKDTVIETKVVVSDTIVVNEVETTSAKAESPTVISKNPIEGMYLVIVQVFTDASNAIDYTYSNDADLEYTLVNGKYYVFAFSSKYRVDAEQFRNAYGKGSWILDPK